MKNQAGRVRELETILSGDDPLVIAEYISSLRNDEAFSGAISRIAAYYDQTSDRQILRVIEDFFNDIKNTDLQPELLESIGKPYSSSTISMLVASCWQSGSDYSAHLNFFTDLFIAGDYSVSIECMTLISENSEGLDSSEKKELLNKLELSLATIQTEKISLLKELILTLS